MERQIDIKIGNAVNSPAKDIGQALQEANAKDEANILILDGKIKSLESGDITDAGKLELGNLTITLKTLKKQLYDRKKAAYRKTIARVYDRGFLIDRLTVDPQMLAEDGLWGEWIPTDPESLSRANLLGFKPDDKYAKNRAISDGGDGSSKVGDVVFMTQPLYMHEVIVEEKDRNYAETHLKGAQKEERNFEASNKDIDMPTMVGSKAENVSGEELTSRMLTK